MQIVLNLNRPTWPQVWFFGALGASLAFSMLLGLYLVQEDEAPPALMLVVTMGFFCLWVFGLKFLWSDWRKGRHDGLIMSQVKVMDAFQRRWGWLMWEVGLAGMALPYLLSQAHGVPLLLWCVPIRAAFSVWEQYQVLRENMKKATP